MNQLLLAIQDTYEPPPGYSLRWWDPFPPDYANFGEQVDWPFYFITWICIFFLVLIVGLMVWFAWRYNRDRGVAADHDAITHHTPLEVTWSGIPLILVIAMFYIGFKGYMDMAMPPVDAYEINVTAQKWSWTFEYANGAITNELHVPPDTPVRLVMKSQDVIHALFIPDFRVKQDIVPGRFSTAWFIATNRSILDDDVEDVEEHHRLFCAEYCGTQHSDMQAVVVVHPTMDDFEAWLAEAIDTGDWPLPALGDAVYQRRGCQGCHRVDGTVFIGPPLNRTWDEVSAGERQFDIGEPIDLSQDAAVENYIRESMKSPQARVVATFPRTMPVTQLKEREIDGVIAIIKWMSENPDAKFPEEYPFAIWQNEQQAQAQQQDQAQSGG